MSERVAYFNGSIVPEREVRVPFRDRGFKFGDAVFDTTRADRMGKGYGRKIVTFVEEQVKGKGGRLLVIETSSKEAYGSTREFYVKIGCTLAAQLPDYYDEGDDKLIYLKPIR